MGFNNIKDKNIIITAGGTGGHIFPALAVAEALQKNGANVTWVGTKDSMENRLVSDKLPIKYIKSSGVRGKGIIKKLLMPIKLSLSVLAARKIIKKTKADIVIGFGGYVSGPTCLAAKTKKVPVIVHEQNAKMGLTNRTIAKFAKKVCLAFSIDNISKLFSEEKLKNFYIVGNPVRNDIAKLNNQTKEFSSEGINLLILGGSQGSRAINTIIPEIIAKANTQNLKITVCHQTGKALFDETKQMYKDIPKQNIKTLAPFVDDMVELYKWADIVICRAGALTVSEVALAGVPAIFIPLPIAADDHQYYNAEIIAKNNAAVNIRQQEANADEILNILKKLDKNRDLLKTMSENAKKTLIKDSTDQILNIVDNSLLK